MSLDVYLYDKKTGIEYYSANITHNLNEMADACGVYYACWRPEEINAKRAKHIEPMLKAGIELLKKYPGFYQGFNPMNGWGSYEGFISWLERYYQACMEHPEAKIRVDR